MNLRKLEKADCKLILDWIKDEREFYIFTGGTLGRYPLSADELYEAYIKQKDELMTFIAEESENIPVGHFALRNVGNGNCRLCYVIIDKTKRGGGYGLSMLEAANKYCFEKLNADKISLAVFKINEPAFNCYKKLGFKIDAPDSIFDFMDGKEICYEMALYRETASN